MYQKNFPLSAATAQVACSDWRSNNLKTVWYNCKNYRINFLLSEDTLFIRDLTKFDDRYQERYLQTPCEGYLATYDNLPIVDSRIWSRDDKECTMQLLTQVSTMDVTEDSETTLRISLTFTDGASGDIILSEGDITFQNCGAISYDWGVPDQDTTLYLDNTGLKGVHNGFSYIIPIEGNIYRNTEDFCFSPKEGILNLIMDAR